ncbi:MAG TPA: hypothetical protein PLJ42_08950 [Chitinophagales bacterium]|nr:hypothetical protein [Chitinophagales bacterium]MBP6155033.1 hypothetical protein [Chitinophagales bacterium]HQV78399.1 hypothetical protein [Chitinophagales bacterium]HQW79550.1 hypothetical protein [Chitinophagales bacterium]HRB66527.1 hypothetical protein [Chitinophagales bacterium]
MKTKLNISALFLAVLVLFSANGIALFEHFCSTSKTKSFQAFFKPTCENDLPISSCCSKLAEKKEKKDCCSHKQLFSKLQVEGFIAKQIQLKSNVDNDIFMNFHTYYPTHLISIVTSTYFSGLPPPDNLYFYSIQSSLQPVLSAIQVYRC